MNKIYFPTFGIEMYMICIIFYLKMIDKITECLYVDIKHSCIEMNTKILVLSKSLNDLYDPSFVSVFIIET